MALALALALAPATVAPDDSSPEPLAPAAPSSTLAAGVKGGSTAGLLRGTMEGEAVGSATVVFEGVDNGVAIADTEVDERGREL